MEKVKLKDLRMSFGGDCPVEDSSKGTASSFPRRNAGSVSQNNTSFTKTLILDFFNKKRT